MQRAIILALGLILAAVADSPFVPSASGQTGEGWITLLDGTNMGTGTGSARANWRLEDGAVVADKLASKGAAHLVSKSSYKDFMLHVEFWASDDANSGIFLRCMIPARSATGPATRSTSSTSARTRHTAPAAIVNFVEVNPMPKAGGKWNTFEITAKGRQITSWCSTARRRRMCNNGLFAEGHHAAARRGRDQVPQGGHQAAVAPKHPDLQDRPEPKRHQEKEHMSSLLDGHRGLNRRRLRHRPRDRGGLCARRARKLPCSTSMPTRRPRPLSRSPTPAARHNTSRSTSPSAMPVVLSPRR